MASAGQGVRSILLEFFPGAELTRLPLADIRVSLPASEARERGPLADEVERLRGRPVRTPASRPSAETPRRRAPHDRELPA